jgi:hypothetical protein
VTGRGETDKAGRKMRTKVGGGDTATRKEENKGLELKARPTSGEERRVRERQSSPIRQGQRRMEDQQ